mmetsp:Transcript_1150/g.1760  ORF Transcript_1150/g.1760 Transcript_1150/m.1760 type:complete len:85 (+) Transcript_1150:591-845(+)
MKRSRAAVAGKSQLSIRARDCNGGKHGRPILGGAGVNSGVTATCDVAGEMSRATDGISGSSEPWLGANDVILAGNISPSSSQQP